MSDQQRNHPIDQQTSHMIRKETKADLRSEEPKIVTGGLLDKKDRPARDRTEDACPKHVQIAHVALRSQLPDHPHSGINMREPPRQDVQGFRWHAKPRRINRQSFKDSLTIEPVDE